MSPRTKSRLYLALRIGIGAIVVTAFALFVRGMDWRALGEALREAAIWPIVLATVANFFHLYLRAVRWRVMLRHVARVSVWRMFRYTVANYAASTILPARVGEVVRVWLLKQREGISAATAAAVAIGEKLLAVLAMLVLVAPLPWLLPGLPRWVKVSVALLAVLSAVSLIACALALRWRARHPAERPLIPSPGPHVSRAGNALRSPRVAWMLRFVDGVDVLRRPRALTFSLILSVAAWLIDVIGIALILHAVGIDIPWAGTLLILFTINMAVAMPSTPAQVGAFELGAIFALEVLAVPRPQAVAFALLFHAIQVVPLGLIGLAEIRLLSQLKAAAAQTPAEAEPGTA